ncbi:hypothetical protein FHS52_001081 [Erythromicrobium ramosum]|uniref:Uncharacterized protein n=1 Tax=Erythrobacter ramosus TaxID=35811 RepID=A0A6I4UH84_9SPHN|nr:hypothetical protein [Erythrobacter ramosus]MBB3775138.1 hypothetical protein [Erythrobacter ramosus]MXP37234.1 hypothetical protein [Erythrobacter ramosus]
MKRYQALFLGIAALAAPANAASEQFNLLCTGTMTETSTFSPDKASQYQKEFRIDLASGRWCEGECKRPSNFATVEADRLVFIDHEDETKTLDSRSLEMVDRTTGKHSSYVMVIAYGRQKLTSSSVSEGDCEIRPFSGFPEVVTKF